tara:strand:+ start:5317 stop:6669 length:1353 start_codon:yes stop_codon:yes gene_type:complete
MNTFQDDLRTEIEDVLDEFTVTDMYQLGSLPAQIKTFDAPMQSMQQALAGMARNIIVETVRDGLSKEPKGFQDAMEMLIIDMVANTKRVESASYAVGGVGTIAAGGSNTGTGTVIINNAQPRTHNTTETSWQTTRHEVLNLECEQDHSGGSVLGKEQFRITGKEAVSSFDADWPAGSGLNKTIRVTSAKALGTSRTTTPAPGENALVNSDFQSWASSTLPSRWVDNGSGSHSGTKQEKNTTAAYIWNSESSGNLQLNGNGSFQHKLTQKLKTATGTPASVRGGKNYIISCRIRIAAGSGTIGSGALEFNIQSSSSGSKVSAATKTVDLSSIGTSWVHVNQTWNFSETEIPSDPLFSIECTTAIANTKSLIIDELVMAEIVQHYAGGPGIIIVRGNTDFRTKDTFTSTFAHSATPPGNEMQMMFDQLLGISSMNLNLPSHTSPEIADSLIA